MANIKGLMISNRLDWETPKELFDELNKEFHFTLDPCATFPSMLVIFGGDNERKNI